MQLFGSNTLSNSYTQCVGLPRKGDAGNTCLSVCSWCLYVLLVVLVVQGLAASPSPYMAMHLVDGFAKSIPEGSSYTFPFLK